MNILLDLINNPTGAGREVDHRYGLWVDIGRTLRARGHKIYVRRVNHAAECPEEFVPYRDRLHRRCIDFYACHSPYGNRQREELRTWMLSHRKWLGNRQARNVVCYDHGWLYKSLVVDRNKLFGDSYYYNMIHRLIQDGFDRDAAEAYRLALLQQNLSKRPQLNLDPVPNESFIFVAAQVLYDASVVYYSKTGLLELSDRVIAFAADHNLHVVFKPHPGMSSHPTHGKEIIDAYCSDRSEQYPFFHVVRASIYELMNRALFTVCVNSGSIVDNLVTQTPVYCCGNSFFARSGTVIYDPLVERGLDTIYRREYDWAHMRDYQLKMLWWLRQNLLQEEFSTERNIELLESHSGAKF